MDDSIEFENEKARILQEAERRIRNADKKLRSLKFALEECLKWSEKHHEGLLLQANLYRWPEGVSNLTVLDWEKNQERTIPLDSSMSRQKTIARCFQTSKRQREAISGIRAEIAKTEETKVKFQSLKKSVGETQELTELLLFRDQLIPAVKIKAIKAEIKALPYRIFFTASGLQIWVGKSAKENDLLTFKLAHGSDCWLHVQGFAGSHVIIKGCKGKPDEEALQDALLLALYYSQAKGQGKAEIVVTQQKYVTRLGKGQRTPGKVQVSQHKLFHVKFNPKRFERLKERSRQQFPLKDLKRLRTGRNDTAQGKETPEG